MSDLLWLFLSAALFTTPTLLAQRCAALQKGKVT